MSFKEEGIYLLSGKEAWIVGRVSIDRPQALRRMLVRAGEHLGPAWKQMSRLDPPVAQGDILLVIDHSGVNVTPDGTHDGVRDGANSRAEFIREFIWTDDPDDLKAELEALGGEYNPR